MENGVVNLINSMPQFRHAVIALTEASSFRERIAAQDASVFALHKRPGSDIGAYARLFKLLRTLKPSVVHTRNIGTLDCTLVALLAGVRNRVHGEHGWDVHDAEGTNRKYRLLRRALFPLVNCVITVSRDLETWLREVVGIGAPKVVCIPNGVDLERFDLRRVDAVTLPPERFPPGCVIVGSVTRFSEIKDPLNLVRAFVAVRRRFSAGGPDVRLLMAGSGPLLRAAETMLADEGMSAAAWLPGSRDDVPVLLGRMDLFALGSRREGISNTVLEAMASGLPVVASDTGGNREVVLPGETGALVPPEDSAALAEAIALYVGDPQLRAQHGAAGRRRVVQEYSLARMVDAYGSVYSQLCAPAEAL